MTTARDIMTGNAECASVNDTLVDAARKLRDLDVGVLSQADIARHLPEQSVGDLVEAISSAPSST